MIPFFSITLFSSEHLLLFALLWTNLFEHENAQTRRKHEKKAKKTRKKYEILRVFRLKVERIIGLKQSSDRCKKSVVQFRPLKPKGQNDPIKSKTQNEPLVWLKTNHTTSCQDGARLKLYRRLRRGGTQKCHLVIFSKNLLTKSDLCVILL